MSDTETKPSALTTEEQETVDKVLEIYQQVLKRVGGMTDFFQPVFEAACGWALTKEIKDQAT